MEFSTKHYYKTLSKMNISAIFNYVLSKISNKIPHNPFWVQIEPTTKCNLNCFMCPRILIEDKNIDMTYETFKTIIGKIPNNILIYMMQGFGEPFLNPDIFKMFDEIKKKKAVCVTTSNGTVLTEEICKKIVNSGLDAITFSVDGSTEETYQKIRHFSLEKVKHNIATLISYKHAAKSDLVITLACVLMQENMNEVESYLKMSEELGVDMVSFQNMTSTENFPTDNITHAIKDNIRDELPAYLKQLKEKHNFKFHIKFVPQSYASPGHNIKCAWPWQMMYIDVHGNVTHCCVIRDKIIGNLLKQSFEEIWKGPEYEKFRSEFKYGVPLECKNCLTAI